MALGDALKKYRELKGLSQSTVCKALGISNTALSQYESNQRQPAINKVIKLADYYNVSLDSLCREGHHQYLDITNLDKTKIDKIMIIINEKTK